MWITGCKTIKTLAVVLVRIAGVSHEPLDRAILLVFLRHFEGHIRLPELARESTLPESFGVVLGFEVIDLLVGQEHQGQRSPQVPIATAIISSTGDCTRNDGAATSHGFHQAPAQDEGHGPIHVYPAALDYMFCNRRIPKQVTGGVCWGP